MRSANSTTSKKSNIRFVRAHYKDSIEPPWEAMEYYEFENTNNDDFAIAISVHTHNQWVEMIEYHKADLYRPIRSHDKSRLKKYIKAIPKMLVLEDALRGRRLACMIRKNFEV